MHSRKLSVAAATAALLTIFAAQTTLAALAKPIYSAGTGSIMQTWGADLDDGVFNGPGPDDLHFDAVTNSKRFIETQGGALMLRMPSKPLFSDCKNAALVDGRYRTSFNVGRWFCVRTDHHRYARFKILSDTPGEPLPIRYVTWCKASDDCVHP
jgi:hypothetical protein